VKTYWLVLTLNKLIEKQNLVGRYKQTENFNLQILLRSCSLPRSTPLGNKGVKPNYTSPSGVPEWKYEISYF